RQRKGRYREETVPFMVAIREERVVAVLASPELGDLLRVAELAGMSYGADALALVFEGVLPVAPINPVTDAAWERGDAEQVWLDHDGGRRGWVTEIAITAIGLRGGTSMEEVWPFVLDNNVPQWADEPL